MLFKLINLLITIIDVSSVDDTIFNISKIFTKGAEYYKIFLFPKRVLT